MSFWLKVLLAIFPAPGRSFEVFSQLCPGCFELAPFVRRMLAEIKRYLATAQAIEMLLYPYAEVVLHDLATDKIVAIFNSFSHREKGDDSLLEATDVDESKDVIGPYEKLNSRKNCIKKTGKSA